MSVFERWNRQSAELGHDTFDPMQTYHMRGIPDEQICITVDCREAASRIVAGLGVLAVGGARVLQARLAKVGA